MNITLTPETLRELRALDAQRASEQRQVWKVIGYCVLVFLLMGLVAAFWYVFLGLTVIFAALVFRIFVRTRHGHTPPSWYARVATWLR